MYIFAIFPERFLFYHGVTVLVFTIAKLLGAKYVWPYHFNQIENWVPITVEYNFLHRLIVKTIHCGYIMPSDHDVIAKRLIIIA